MNFHAFCLYSEHTRLKNKSNVLSQAALQFNLINTAAKYMRPRDTRFEAQIQWLLSGSCLCPVYWTWNSSLNVQSMVCESGETQNVVLPQACIWARATQNVGGLCKKEVGDITYAANYAYYTFHSIKKKNRCKCMFASQKTNGSRCIGLKHYLRNTF